MKTILFSIFLTCFYSWSTAQSTLDTFITLAQQKSGWAKIAVAQQHTGEFAFLKYKTTLRPLLTLQGELPAFSRDFFDVRQPDGSLLYLLRSQNNAYAGLSFSQPLAFSGGNISLNTGLSRFDNFTTMDKQYNGAIFNIRIEQPLFAFNPFKWLRRIEPLKLEASKRQYLLEMQDIAYQTTQLYFQAISARESLKATAERYLINQQILAIENKRIDLGTTTKEKLLQSKLQLLQEEQQLQADSFLLQQALSILINYVGIEKNELSKEFIVPEMQGILIDEQIAIDQAMANRPEFLSFEIKKLEAQRDEEDAKKNKNTIRLTTSAGINGAGDSFGAVWNNIKDQQWFNIGLTIPVMDWGRNELAFKTAQSFTKLTNEISEQASHDYQLEIINLIAHIRLLQQSYKIIRERERLSIERFQLAFEQYQTGKLTFTELDIAGNEKEVARMELFNTIRSFWELYALLKKLTLYDFEKKLNLKN